MIPKTVPAKSSPLKIGWFSTGRGEGSYGLLKSGIDAIESGKLNAEISFVFVNRVQGQTRKTDQFLNLIESKNIPLVTLSSRDFRRSNNNKPWSELRKEFDRNAIELLKPYKVDIAVQAGYMLIAPILCKKYLTLNLHPALPGGTIGVWQQAVWDVIGGELKETGVMIHVATEKVDQGPVLSMTKFSVRGHQFDPLWEQLTSYDLDSIKSNPGEELPLFQAIRKAGLIRERPMLIATIKAVAEGRINPEGSGEIVDLTEEVESLIYG
ncbi:MAG: hypothetical protein FI699_00170 [SAR202 cluster bacterium]|nr:hypothetical protein [SAR202 cluster bacterium]